MVKKINLNGKEIEYSLERKNVKNINLRIKSDLSIHVSANKRIPEKVIDDFLKAKSDFIFNALSKYSVLKENSPKPNMYISGENLNILGRSLTLIVNEGTKSVVTNDEQYIYLTVKDTDNFSLKEKSIDKWKKAKCQEIVMRICESTYPLFEKHISSFPEIRFRKMTSQWGNCHTKRNILTFNTALIEVPIPCIEYVVMHEFTHFIEANHSRNFYNKLELFMPDWKSRKKLLKKYRL